MKSKKSLKVYYDGLCMLCSREIEHYRRQPGAENIAFLDICSPQFDAAEEGLDPLKIHQVMHVRKEDGTIAIRVDAFIEIWKVLPKYQLLSKLASNSLARRVLDVGYTCFAKIRPWLPRFKNKSNCHSSPYCDVKRAPNSK